jgi:hypothetical protein
MNVYGIGMKIARKERTGFFRRKEIINWYGGIKIFPIIANSEEEAIETFKQTREYKNKCTYSLIDLEFENPDAVDVKVYVYSINKFTFEQLKKQLKADDFMAYCKEKLGLNGTIKEITN